MVCSLSLGNSLLIDCGFCSLTHEAERHAAVCASGYSRRGDRSPRLCCRTVHESFHLTRLLKRVVLVRHTVDARAPSSPRGHTDATVASSCPHLAHRQPVG